MNLADPNCPRCSGEGIFFSPTDHGARAQVCACRSTCPKCKGVGRVLVDNKDGRRMARCGCQRLPDRVAILNRANLPSRHANSSFRSYDSNRGDRSALMQCQGWAGSFALGQDRKGLLLWGEVGRGKTHLLVATLKYIAVHHGARVRFVEFTHLLAELRAGIEQRRRGNAKLLTSLQDVDVLAIDELGKGRCTEWELSILDDLISRAYNGMRTLVGSTNYSPHGGPSGVHTDNLALPEQHRARLVDRVGLRIHSRLMEMSQPLPVRGEDYRIVGQRPR